MSAGSHDRSTPSEGEILPTTAGAPLVSPDAETQSVHSANPTQAWRPDDGAATGPPYHDREAAPPQIGKYRVIQKLGVGGQATVYRAVHSEISGRDVVIKWANADLTPEAQRSILDEGRILAELDDPGLVRVYDVDVAEGRPYVVFEYVGGRTLRDEAKGTTIDARRAASITADLAHTLEQAHRRGVLHRDLKPANILIDAQGRTRVLDFGLGTSSAIWTDSKEIDPGISGTLSYMAPEQAEGNAKSLGPWTDVFGLGAILFELLTGRPPHDLRGLDVRAALECVRTGKIKPPRALRPTVDKDLEAIALRALAAVPERRYRNAGELEAALRNYLRRPSLRVLAGRLALAVLLIGGSVAAWFALREPEGASTGPTASAPNDKSASALSPAPISTAPISTAPISTAPISTAPIPTAPLDGSLNVRVWSADGSTKRGLLVSEPAALPVFNGDQVHVEAGLNHDAYLYLLWIDSDGKVTRLDDVSAGEAKPRRALHSPAKLDQGWEVVGSAGLETVVLLASEKPLPSDVDLAKLIGTLPPSGRDSGNGYIAFDVERTPVDATSNCIKVTGGAPGGERGLGAIKTINDPVVHALEQLRARFDLVKAVRFAHR